MSRVTPPIHPPILPGIPGRVIVQSQGFWLTGDIVREKRHVIETFQAADGAIRTDDRIEVVPPLECGCITEEMTDVIICLICHMLVCKSKHSFTCRCGGTFCVGCRVRVEIEDQEVELCKNCARQATTPVVIRKLCNLIWGE